jgi:hypothetical protein
MREKNEAELRLYFLQHKLLPAIFYNPDRHLIKQFLANGNKTFIDLMITMVLDGKTWDQTECPYTENEFQTRFYLYPDTHTTLIRQDMPKPTIALLCRNIYLAMNTDTGDRFVYTVELAENGHYFLCGWADGDCHMIFNVDLNDDPATDQEKILALFANQAQNRLEIEKLIQFAKNRSKRRKSDAGSAT